MAKRTAASELTDRNWDQEDEPEEVGVFAQATTDILKNRPMKKAKRRTQNESTGTSSFSAFGGFAGLAAKKPTPTVAGSSIAATEKVENPSNGFTDTVKTASTNKNTSYYHSLKSLNKSVLEWIKKHIERDPYCILTPIFTDYSKHLEDIKKNNNNEEKSDSLKENSNDSDPEIVFNIKKGKSLSPVKEKVPSSSIFSNTGTAGLSFASTTSTSSAANVIQSSTTTTNTSGFTFTPSTTSFGGFGTSAFTSATNKPTDNQEGEEEYEPPKPETREINEEGAVYSKRCKIFYQKDGKWKDRGVGNLHLKPDEEGKTQLIIRADTTLGNILLNIMLSSVIPTKKQGKNNVWMLCVPNPPVDVKDDSGKPVPMLLRVKTSEDADELLDKLEEFKK
ncbi:hypothetical protein LOTGIDRAFT_233352 [Lottia gigantea]|uniref:RanBD1 domain-containing protein n=1 Tax=Lottia gigantea TaxID=225164 RepID=V4A4Y7_LOTGI|nr:hypothetical protein LOTGIDRAFT_233352 [Lottia gigantea]ESO91777.1 hypothetical protein LOTGIDRAFT_233352 [Lottia gigantea]